MPIRISRPEPVRIELPTGDWLIVKKSLTAGEERDMVWRMIRTGKEKPDPLLFSVAKLAAYLLDWSIVDADNKPIVIRDESPHVIQSILDMLDKDDYDLIWAAVESHADAVAEEKKRQHGLVTSEPISPLRAPLVGAMSG